jgi:hypothetical protein
LPDNGLPIKFRARKTIYLNKFLLKRKKRTKDIKKSCLSVFYWKYIENDALSSYKIAITFGHNKSVLYTTLTNCKNYTKKLSDSGIWDVSVLSDLNGDF